MTKKTRFDQLHYAFLAGTIIFAGAFIGSVFCDFIPSSNIDSSKKIIRSDGSTYVSVKNLTEEFKVELETDNEFAVYGGKTWIPVPGSPVELVILTDPTCGKKCNTTQSLGSLRQAVTPALLAREVDINSDEGKDLQEKFEVTAIPQYIFGAGIEDHKTPDNELFVIKSAEILNGPIDGMYLLNGSRVGFKPGKFIEMPDFADLDDEPKKGNGKVRVVEFTDYQCPYCKRLFDQNKDLIDRLIDEGKIEYVMKDFPLGFHKEAVTVHVAANCAQKLEGNEAYWNMHEKIFDNQRVWSGKGEGAKAEMKKYAQELVLDETAFDECVNDKDMVAEVKADQAEGAKYGVSGTPALFIGKQVMPGAIGPKAFEDAVNSELE